MKYLWKFTPWVVVGVCAFVAWREFRDADAAYRTARADAEAKAAQVSVWQAKYIDASMQAARVDTVWRQAKARADSVRVPVVLLNDSTDERPGTVRVDSAQLAAYVESREAMIGECERLADVSAVFRGVADSLITKRTVERDAWKRVAELNRPRFRDRFGITIGYGAVVQGGIVRAGPTVGVTMRAWP